MFVYRTERRKIKPTGRRSEKPARREVNYLVFANFSICSRDVLIMQSSRLAILHEQEHFPALIGRGPKASWMHIVLQDF